MERVTYFDWNGTQYPLCCSLGALEEILKIYGSVEKFIDITTKDGDLEAYTKALAILMKHGAKRVKKYDGTEITPPTHEEIIDEAFLDDIAPIRDAVWEAIGKSKKNEIAGKPVKKSKSAK